MSNSIQGSCQCGQISYSFAGPPLMTYACHCQDCQKRTGSAFSMGSIVFADSLKLDGELSSWVRTSDDGNINTRHSCKACGNVIYGSSSHSPSLLRLQTGTINNSQTISPDAHIWLKRSHSWLTLPDDAIAYQTQPDDLSEVMQRVVERRQSNFK